METRGDKYEGELKTGQRIHSILYGGRDGIIARINGQQDPGSIRSLGGGCVVMGGRATIDVVFEEYLSRGIPESIIRGVQWFITDEYATPDEILAALSHADMCQQEEKAKKLKAEEERVQDRAALPGKYPFLIPLKNAPGKSSHAMGAKNLKTELERVFKGIKFSVKSQSYSGGDSIHVGWVDGPLQEEVEKISGKYQEGHFDGMNDIYESNQDNVFPDVFGGAKYVNESRHESKELVIKAAKELGHDVTPEMFDKYGNMMDGPFSWEKQQEIYRLSRTMKG